jgi:dihydroneopterin aldolase
MTDRILIVGLRELGVHGVLAEEQTRPQPFEVDVELEVDVRAAGASDDLEDTVDYAAVAEAITRVVSSERYQLLERLATRIGEVCCADLRVTGVTVTVRKLNAPVRAMLDHVAVRIRR